MRIKLMATMLFLSAWLYGQENFGDVTISQTHYFGINLIPSISGDIYHFAEIEVISDGKYRYNWLTRQEFILKASGMVASKANPNTVDLFKQYGITDDNKYWDPIDNLWRLRFDGHPLYPSDNSGWFVPNPKYTIPDSEIYKNGACINPFMKARRDSLIRVYNNQWKLLNEFGIHKFSDFAMGDKVFAMLKAVQNRAWIEGYINKPLPGPFQQMLRGQKPTYKSVTAEQRKKEMQIHNPYQDVTIRNVQRSGLDQLIKGVKKP